MNALIDIYLAVLLYSLIIILVGLCAGYYICDKKLSKYEKYMRKVRKG